jgi:hypothetical protein
MEILSERMSFSKSEFVENIDSGVMSIFNIIWRDAMSHSGK